MEVHHHPIAIGSHTARKNGHKGACDGLLDQQRPALAACKKLIEMIKKEYQME